MPPWVRPTPAPGGPGAACQLSPSGHGYETRVASCPAQPTPRRMPGRRPSYGSDSCSETEARAVELARGCGRCGRWSVVGKYLLGQQELAELQVMSFQNRGAVQLG